MRFLITGGAGFIGSHLCEALLARGDEVCVLDDLSTGSLANLEAVIDHPGFDHEVGSAEDAEVVTRLLERCDATVHLAAAVGVKLIIDQPVRTITTNVDATRVVLDASVRDRKPVMIASTSEVYGKSERVPFREDDDLSLGATNRSRWAYACSKALDEWLGFAYLREARVPVKIVRLFNVVGPRQTGRYGMVLPSFAAQALAGDPITVHGTGEQTRSFGHVRDVVHALLRVLDHDSAIGEVVNVGSDEEVSIRALAERVKALSRSASEIVHVPYDEAYAEGFEDMPRRVPDLTKLERLTGFRARTALDEIIEDVLSAQRGQYFGTSISRT